MGFRMVLWLLCMLGLQAMDSSGVESSGVKGGLEGDRVEIIDYKRGKILGFMIVRNGNIVKRVLFKEPKSLESSALDSSPTTLESKQATPQRSVPLDSSPTTPQNTTPQNPVPQTSAPLEPKKSAPPQNTTPQATQNIYEQQISNAPKDKASKAPKISQVPKIAQEVGIESTRTNPTYKNRQWDKRHIIHDISTEVIEIER